MVAVSCVKTAYRLKDQRNTRSQPMAITCSISHLICFPGTSMQRLPTRNGRGISVTYGCMKDGCVCLSTLIHLFCWLGNVQSNETRSSDPGPDDGNQPIKTTAGPHTRTDRGSQYCSQDYQKILRQHGIQISMSGQENCYNNAAVETFFQIIKAKLIWH